MDFKLEIAKSLQGRTGSLSQEEIMSLLEVPPEKTMGDYAFPCFKLAKEFRKAPPAIAAELVSSIEKGEALEKVEALGGYVNFFVNKKIWVQDVLEEAVEKGDDFGKADVGQGKKVIVEYSSVNIAKPFHIGHIRSTVIGHALNRLYQFLGYDTVSVNHLGDYGTQFGLLIAAYKGWGNREDIERDPINELLKLYVAANEKDKEDPTFRDEARAYFKKLEEGNEEAVALWTWIREISLKEFARVYEMLGIQYDSLAGESFYSDKMPRVLKLMEEKSILVESQGARIVDLEPYGLTPAPIIKKDGSTLYITRDLAAAIYRKETYDFYKNIYVVGAPQELHFKQWIKILQLMDFDWAKDCVHVPFGTVSLEDGALSTRKGKVVFLEDVLDKAVEKTKEVIIQKNPDLDNLDQVAKQVGVGAVVFQELSNSRIKDYTFSWDRTLSFDGETGPYVQYTHARCCSLLEKSGVMPSTDLEYEILSSNEDVVGIIRVLDGFQDTLLRSADRYEPHHVARFVLDLAQAFNKFYHDNQILTEDAKTRQAFITLTMAVKKGLKNGLWILGIDAPEKM